MIDQRLYRKRKRHLLVFVSLFALGACASSSSVTKPWVMPAEISSGLDGAGSYPAGAGGLYLDVAPKALILQRNIQDLLVEALEHNPAIRIAKSRQSEAIANRDNVNAGFMPQLEVGAGTSRTRTGNEASSESAVSSGSSRGSLDLRIPIDVFGERSARSEAAAYQVAQATAELEDTHLNVMRDVVVVALDASEQNQLKALNVRQLETNKTSEQLTKLRYTKGQADIVDVLQQKDLVASLNQEAPGLIAARQNALDNLSILAGKLPGSVATDEFLNIPEIPEIDRLVSPKALLVTRPDMLALKAGLDAADSRVSAAIRDRLPSLEFSSSAVATLVSGDISSVISGTLSAAFTLFDGGAKRAVVRAERAALEQKGAIYIEAWLRAVVEVDTLLSEEKRRAAEYVLAEVRLENARKLHSAAERRYRLGASDYLLVLSAKRTIEQQERSLLSLKASLMRARVRLHTAMGGKISVDIPDATAAANAQASKAIAEI